MEFIKKNIVEKFNPKYDILLFIFLLSFAMLFDFLFYICLQQLLMSNSIEHVVYKQDKTAVSLEIELAKLMSEMKKEYPQLNKRP